MPQTTDLSQYHVRVVYLDHDPTVIIVDHANKRLNSWRLIDGKWVEADVAEATHNGKIYLEGPPMPSLSDLPPLPENLWWSPPQSSNP